MKTYWCVTSSFDDQGHAKAAITDSVKRGKKPCYTYKSCNSKDIYIDWFDNRQEAEEYVESIRNC